MVSPEEGLADPLVAVVVAIALSVASATNKFLSIKNISHKHIFYPDHLSSKLCDKLPFLDRDAGAVTARELGLVARGENKPSVLLSVPADVVGEDPVFWANWKSRFVGHLQNSCVVVKRDYFPTVGTSIALYFCLLEAIEYNPVFHVFAIFLHVNHVLDVHDVLQMTTGSEE